MQIFNTFRIINSLNTVNTENNCQLFSFKYFLFTIKDPFPIDLSIHYIVKCNTYSNRYWLAPNTEAMNNWACYSVRIQMLPKV